MNDRNIKCRKIKKSKTMFNKKGFVIAIIMVVIAIYFLLPTPNNAETQDLCFVEKIGLGRKEIDCDKIKPLLDPKEKKPEAEEKTDGI